MDQPPCATTPEPYPLPDLLPHEAPSHDHIQVSGSDTTKLYEVASTADHDPPRYEHVVSQDQLSHYSCPFSPS